MTNSPRFKIDISESSYEPFALYWRKPTWMGGKWVTLGAFKSQGDAHDFYHRIKGLPEYLP